MVIIQLTETEFHEAITKAVKQALELQKPEVSDDLLCRHDTALYLKVSLPTLNIWEKKGYITPIRIGARVYYKKSTLLNQNITKK